MASTGTVTTRPPTHISNPSPRIVRRFKKIIGVVDDQRTARITMVRFGDDQNPALVADTDEFQIHQVCWPVLDGLSSEGLLVTPKQRVGRLHYLCT